MGWLIFDIALTCAFAVMILSDLRWMTRIARFQRDQEGWSDDVGWVFTGSVVSGLLITALWIEHPVVMLIAVVLLFGARKKRREAYQRAFTAKQQREFDKGFAEFQKRDGEPVDPAKQEDPR